MFALFFSLYYAMFSGSWRMFSLADIRNTLYPTIDMLGKVLTSMFNDVTTPVTNVGDTLLGGNYPNYLVLTSFILALITSIGIVVMAVKGIKRVFGVFFMGIRNI